jgi:hypothetical protein
MYQPWPSSGQLSGPERAFDSRAGAARHRLRLTRARLACPDRREGSACRACHSSLSDI